MQRSGGNQRGRKKGHEQSETPDVSLSIILFICIINSSSCHMVTSARGSLNVQCASRNSRINRFPILYELRLLHKPTESSGPCCAKGFFRIDALDFSFFAFSSCSSSYKNNHLSGRLSWGRRRMRRSQKMIIAMPSCRAPVAITMFRTCRVAISTVENGNKNARTTSTFAP